MWSHLSLFPWLALAALAAPLGFAPASQQPGPYRYSYYLFEAPGMVKGGSDCYIPLLVTRRPLEEGDQPEVAVIHTYERDSIWRMAANPVKLEKGAVTTAERTLRFEGKLYRYQLVPNAEAIRLLENPDGKIPIHRIQPPVDQDIEPLRKTLLRDLKGGTSDGKK
jgi:hypothetical protein